MLLRFSSWCLSCATAYVESHTGDHELRKEEEEKTVCCPKPNASKTTDSSKFPKKKKAKRKINNYCAGQGNHSYLQFGLQNDQVGTDQYVKESTATPGSRSEC